MATINVSELCYANNGYFVVNCNKYDQFLAEYSKDGNHAKTILIVVFGTIGGAIALLILCAWVDDIVKKFKSAHESHLVQILTPRNEV